MPSSPTTRARLEKQATGENLNSWGDRLNQNGMDLIDEAIAGVETIALTGDLTLSSVNYATDQARNFGLRFTGTGGAVTIPSVEKVYAVRNDCAGTVTLKTSAGLGAVLPAGDAAVVICDGTNCRFASVTEGRVAALIAAAALSGGLPAVAGQDGKFLRTSGGGILWDTALPDANSSKGLALRAKRDGSGGEWAAPGEAAVRTVLDYTFPATYTTPRDVAVVLTPTLSLHFVSSATALFAVAVDAGAGTVGTPTSVDTTTNGPKHAFRISDTQAIVFWVDGSNNHKAAVLTVAGTTVSVGTAASTATAFLALASFTDRPVIAQITANQFVVLYGNGGNALLITASGASVTISAAATVTATPQAAVACYRVTDTQALALYVDDSGTAGAPYSLRGVVLTLDGSGGLTVGTSGGINDVCGAIAHPSCRLTDNKYVVAFGGAGGTFKAVCVTVTGSVAAFGAALTIETDASRSFDLAYTNLNANRFHPLLSPLDTTRVLCAYAPQGYSSRHVVLTENGGALTAGNIAYGLFVPASLTATKEAAMFAARPDGALIACCSQTSIGMAALAIAGSTITHPGSVSRNGMGLWASATRFALSSGIFGVSWQTPEATGAGPMAFGYHLFRYVSGAAPVYLGEVPLSGLSSTQPAIEVAPNRLAILGYSRIGASATNYTYYLRIQILEFAA